jgi:hypothetical protein
MHLYDFEVLMDGAVVAAERAVDKPGCKIRVKDDSGRIVILTGVASVLRHARTLAA